MLFIQLFIFTGMIYYYFVFTCVIIIHLLFFYLFDLYLFIICLCFDLRVESLVVDLLSIIPCCVVIADVSTFHDHALYRVVSLLIPM